MGLFDKILEQLRQELIEREEELKYEFGIDDIEIINTWADDVAHIPCHKRKKYQ